MSIKRKICIFSPFYRPHLGGVERFTESLATRLFTDYGYSAVVVTFNTNHCRPIEDAGEIHVYRLPAFFILKKRFPLPVVNFAFTKMLLRILDEDADCYIINTRFAITSLIGLACARKNRKPLLLIEHGSGHFQVGGGFLNALGEYYEHIVSSIIRRHTNGAFGVSRDSCEWLGHFGLQAAGIV
jgi:hypothetical protein